MLQNDLSRSLLFKSCFKWFMASLVISLVISSSFLFRYLLVSSLTRAIYLKSSKITRHRYVIKTSLVGHVLAKIVSALLALDKLNTPETSDLSNLQLLNTCLCFHKKPSVFYPYHLLRNICCKSAPQKLQKIQEC